MARLTLPAPASRARPGSFLARHAQHGALSRSGITDDDAEIATVRDMRQRLDLLAGQDKAALSGTRKGGFTVPIIDRVTLRLGHEFGGAMQALLRLDHLLGGEAILPKCVPAEFDQIGRIAHRAHDLVELVDAVAVPVREHRQIAACESRLLMRDRVQRHTRIGDDARAVVARDLAVHFRAVCHLDPFGFNALRGRADLALRLKADALRL